MKGQKFEIEKSGRVWTVEYVRMIADKREFIVHYPDKDKSQVVKIDKYGDHNCTGTHFNYNESCPHVEAALEAKFKMLATRDDNNAEIDETTPVKVKDDIEYYGDVL